MIRVGVLGAGGRMGREVCRAVVGAPDLELAAAVDPSVAGRTVGELIGDPTTLGVDGSVEVLAERGVEVAVDFTQVAVAREHVRWCTTAGVHLVVGTTGFDSRELELLAEQLAGSRANMVVVANFAIGAVLLMRLCEIAAPYMEGVEVIELHHGAKRDAPSGTALHTVERIAAARRRAGSGPLSPDPTTLTVLEGARGGEGAAGIRVHSVRLPGLVAHEEVIFGAAGQTLTLRHDSHERVSFMPGVLLAVRQVAQRPGLTVGLDGLLGF